MKSFGQIVSEERINKKLTLDTLSQITKIKREFLVAIEREKWDTLPDYPVLQGFVKSIGHALDVDENKLVAFLRRDYPPKALPVSPKPDVGDKFKWTPRMTFVVGVLALILVVSGYLFYQYNRFVSPPNLTVDSPSENSVVKEAKLKVSGSTSSDATVIVNNQPFLVDEKGKFEGEIEISNSTHEVEVKSTSRADKETKIIRKISPEL